jgi:transposase
MEDVFDQALVLAAPVAGLLGASPASPPSTTALWDEVLPERRWAIESAAGLGYLLSQQLVDAGEEVLDVPATLAARVRVLGSGRSQKNDPNDAFSTAIAALRQRGLRQVRADDHRAILRMLATRHHDLGALRTQAACRLHASLAALIPGGFSGRRPL